MPRPYPFIIFVHFCEKHGPSVLSCTEVFQLNQVRSTLNSLLSSSTTTTDSSSTTSSLSPSSPSPSLLSSSIPNSASSSSHSFSSSPSPFSSSLPSGFHMERERRSARPIEPCPMCASFEHGGGVFTSTTAFSTPLHLSTSDTSTVNPFFPVKSMKQQNVVDLCFVTNKNSECTVRYSRIKSACTRCLSCEVTTSSNG